MMKKGDLVKIIDSVEHSGKIGTFVDKTLDKDGSPCIRVMFKEKIDPFETEEYVLFSQHKVIPFQKPPKIKLGDIVEFFIKQGDYHTQIGIVTNIESIISIRTGNMYSIPVFIHIPISQITEVLVKHADINGSGAE
jgi:hypothetical protein